MDLGARRVMFATQGKDAETVKAFAQDLTAHAGAPKTQVEQVCCDMSPAFISGITKYLAEQPEGAEAQLTVTTVEAVEVTNSAAVVATADPAGPLTSEGDETEVELHCPQVTFERYHVVAKANEELDELRRAEPKARPELKRSR